MSSNIAGTKADASNTIFVPFSSSHFRRRFNASGLDIVIPIPIAAELGFFGSKVPSRFAAPTVNLSSGNGRTIAFGDKALVGIVLDFGTAI
jgi:hypothetical protein